MSLFERIQNKILIEQSTGSTGEQEKKQQRRKGADFSDTSSRTGGMKGGSNDPIKQKAEAEYIKYTDDLARKRGITGKNPGKKLEKEVDIGLKKQDGTIGKRTPSKGYAQGEPFQGNTNVKDPTGRYPASGRSTLKGTSYEDYSAHAYNVDQVYDRQTIFSNKLTKTMNMVKAMRVSLHTSKQLNNELGNNLFQMQEELNQLLVEVNGNSAKSEIGEKNDPTLSRFISNAARGLSTTYGPTGQHKQSLEIGNSMLDKLEIKLNLIEGKLPSIRLELNNMNAPEIINGAN